MRIYKDVWNHIIVQISVDSFHLRREPDDSIDVSSNGTEYPRGRL